MLHNKIITFIGAGVMTRNLIKGLLQKGHPPEGIVVSNRSPEKLEQLVQDLGVKSASTNTNATATADVLVLAIKPHFVEGVCKEIAPAVKEKKPLLISLATATRLEDISKSLGHEPHIARVMTNIAISVGQGTTALFANSHCSSEQRQITEALFNAVGHSFWVEKETELNTVTPLLGCGPAYLYVMVDALQKAAIQNGVPELTAQLTLDIISSACALAKKSGRPVNELQQNVTTPNGVTAAALNPLIADNHLHGLFDKSYRAALKRCEEIEQAGMGNPSVPKK